MEKSYVSMEQHQCVVCGAVYETGALLLDKRLRPTLERYTVTATSLCAEHARMKEDGFVALVEANKATSRRTGIVAFVKASQWHNVFDVDYPREMFAYVDKDVMDILKQAAEQAAEQTPDTPR